MGKLYVCVIVKGDSFGQYISRYSLVYSVLLTLTKLCVSLSFIVNCLSFVFGAGLRDTHLANWLTCVNLKSKLTDSK